MEEKKKKTEPNRTANYKCLSLEGTTSDPDSQKLKNKLLCSRNGNFLGIFYVWVEMFSALSSKKKNWGFIRIYSSLKYRMGSWGRKESPMKEELRLRWQLKTHYHEKACVNSLCLNVSPLSLACWSLYLWHVGTAVSYIYYL